MSFLLIRRKGLLLEEEDILSLEEQRSTTSGALVPAFNARNGKASVSIYKQASKNAIYEDLLTTKCHFKLPCCCCLTRFGSLEIVREICTRQSIISTRFDNVGEYTLYI